MFVVVRKVLLRNYGKSGTAQEDMKVAEEMDGISKCATVRMSGFEQRFEALAGDGR